LRASACLLGLVLVACGGSSAARSREVSPGTWELDCSSSIGRCTDEANRLCGGRGYDIVSGYDRAKVYGHEAGESQVEVRMSSLTVVCNDKDGKSRLPPDATTTPPAAPPAVVPPAAPASASSRSLLCTPGTTQRCFGAGACEGGQSCLADGSGFGPCDCGPSKPAAPATTAAPGASGF
jgi:hypothetical protein